MSSQKKRIAWNQGKTTPSEVREKQRQAKLNNPVRYWLGKNRPEISLSQTGKRPSARTRRKMSEAKRRNWKDTEYREAMLKSYDPEKRLLNGRRNGALGALKSQYQKEPTSIEKTLYDFLLLKGVLFERQKLVNEKLVVDAYIPSLNLVIEADGCFWHGCDQCGYTKTKDNKDNARTAYLKKCGYMLLRLPEHDIKTGRYKERINNLL